jgi:hypothetical protein
LLTGKKLRRDLQPQKLSKLRYEWHNPKLPLNFYQQYSSFTDWID